ncbi:MAG TPA: FTR1 family protein [Magnetospirillum sp.]|jgi:high-affinity iron transporter|nr:FTR1 family protein [Magnetospirillum sp.]
MRALLRLLVLALIPASVLFASEAGAQEAKLDHRAVAARIAADGNALVAAYDPGEAVKAADGFSDLYFSVFEETGLEADIGAADPAAKTALESQFATIIGLANAGAPKDQVEASWRKLEGNLVEVAAARAAAGSGWLGAFLQSLLILLREGFEAMLVVTALVAYLKRLGAEDKVRVVWQAVALALVASGLTAWALREVVALAGASKEAVEGATMLVAALVLTYVSHWLFARREAQRWQGYIKDQVSKALSGGQLFSLGFAAFLSVYREGAETVLFYQALAGSAAGHGTAIILGFACALAGLAMVYWIMRKASMKLPLAPFFAGTAILLYALAVTFAGQGMLELQEARLIAATPLAFIPSIPALGLFPTAESIGAQALLLAALLPVLGAWALKKAKAATP